MYKLLNVKIQNILFKSTSLFINIRLREVGASGKKNFFKMKKNDKDEVNGI